MNCGQGCVCWVECANMLLAVCELCKERQSLFQTASLFSTKLLYASLPVCLLNPSGQTSVCKHWCFWVVAQATVKIRPRPAQGPSRPVLPFCPFWLHTFICLNSPELHCWLSSHPHCIKMLGLCFRVYVRRSQGAGTDPAKDSMPRACRRGQGLPSDLPKDSLCLHLVVIDCKFVVRKVFGMTLPKTACPGHAIVS